jgi:phospholipase D1/2
MGDRDSEVAIVIEDTDLIESSMNGEKYMATRFAAAFRRQLFKQHLGLIPPQDVPSPVTEAMRAVGQPNEYDWGSDEDQVVQVR